MRELVRFDVGRIVFLTCKSNQSFIVNVNSPWVHGRDANIDSNVEFKAIDEKRIMNIFTNYTRFINRDF